MASLRSNSPIASQLLVDLKRGGGVSLHRQVELALRAGDPLRSTHGGDRASPTRTLAAELGVSRGVVVEAYSQLVAEGYLTSRSGGYTHVAADLDPRPASAGAGDSGSKPSAPEIDFGYGRANVAGFPRRDWLRSVRRVLSEAPDESLSYPDGQGAGALREALADYLNRVRGTVARPENLVVTNGYAQGIALLLGVLAARGARRLAVEDPSANDDARPDRRQARDRAHRRPRRRRRRPDRRAGAARKPTR